MSCSSGDDTVKGCTDPVSANYNADATENDNSCQYSIVGNWRIVKFTNGSTNILSVYSSLNMNILSNGTTSTYGVLTDGSTRSVNGTYLISGSDNSTLTLTNTNGDSTVWTFIDITSTSFSITSSNLNGQPATIEGVKI